MTTKTWLIVAAIVVVLGGGMYACNERENAARQKLRADMAVSVLPPGVEEAWIRYVDRRLHAAVRPSGSALAVVGLLDLARDSTTLVSLNTPYKVSCDPMAGGSIEFGYGDSGILVPVYGAMAFRAEPAPELGVIKSSVAAKALSRTLCERISMSLRRMISR